MERVKKLFNYQKFEGNKLLDEVIQETHSRYQNNVIELRDDEMEQVAAGVCVEQTNLEKRKY